MTSYFMSYSRRDQEFARRVAHDLAARDRDVFFDQTSITPGSDWTTSIQAALDRCTDLIVVLSPHALASGNVLDETRYALDHRKRVIPIYFRECVLPFWLWRIEYIDFQGEYGDAFGSLLTTLQSTPRAISLPVGTSSPAMEASRAGSSRNLIICFDHQLEATFDFRGNVFKLARMAESVSERQIVYYDPGVQAPANRWSPFGGVLGASARIWLGAGVGDHVGHAYRFLMETYRTGDQVFLFGSSGGAQMANALARALDCFWLVEKASPVVIPYVVQSVDRVTIPEAREFRAALSRECFAYFIGMWDCVQLYGGSGAGLSELHLPARTPFAFHALAIDERRKWFRPLLWRTQATADQTIEQVWFAGAHSDVCGGYAEHGLADLTLRWMIDKANSCGMLIDEEDYGRVRPDALAPIHDSATAAWRLWGIASRQIPKGSLIDPSVRDRQRAGYYAPHNLPAPQRG